MSLGLQITRTWESVNACGGALADALKAIRDAETPDELGNALVLLEEAKRANTRASGQIQLAIDDAAKRLVTR